MRRSAWRRRCTLHAPATYAGEWVAAIGSPFGEGLRVDSASGPAAAAGIQAGDVILAFNRTPVQDVQLLVIVA